jgi:quercetin dioxygenase-like cupin family protein
VRDVPSKPRAALWFLDNLVLVHLRGDETEGRWDLIEFWAATGDQPPPHVHNLHDESFYVTAGEVTLFLPDRRIVMGPGQFFLAPRGVPHTYRVTSTEQARWLVTSAPAGIEAFVQEFGRSAEELRLPDPEPPDIERLIAVTARRGMEILGPPGVLPSELPPAVLAAYSRHAGAPAEL